MKLELEEHHLDLGLDSIDPIKLLSWLKFVEIENDAESESDYFYWSSDAPEEAKQFSAYDVYYKAC